MKLKGVSWVEANFEKLIVGVMLLVCLAVLVLQFVVVSNKVEVGGQRLSLGNAFAPAEEEANRVIAAMENDSPSLPEFEETADLGATYAASLGAGVSPVDRLAAFGSAVDSVNELGGSDVLLGNTFAVFTPPQPPAPLAVSYRATLNPFDVAEYDGLAALLPAEQPYDTAWVSAEVRIDPSAIDAAFRADPDGAAGEIQPLPQDWWRSKQAVLAVEFERQQRQADGSWAGSSMVQPLPGFEPAIDLSISPSNWRELDQVASRAGQAEDAALRPGFYDILEGEPWRPPSAVPSFEDAERGQDQIRVLERRLQGVRGRIDDRRRALEQVGDRDTDPGREGGRETDRGRQPVEEEAGDPNQRRIEREIERLEQQEQEIVAELEGLGWSEQGELADAFDLESWLSSQREQTGETPAWGHDLRLAQGGVYRYRARLVMANPLFGRAASLADEQKQAAASAYVRSPWSDWSEPVETGWSEYFFVERASAGTGLGGQARPTARGELYRFHYGYWRRAVVSLEPGDRFVAQVDLPEGLQIWDTETPAQEQAWNPEPDAEQPDGLELVPTSMPVAANAWLLDVVASPFSTSGGLAGVDSVTFDAVIRGPDGMVSRRSPDQERADPLYQRIASSAQAGEDQVPSIPGVGRRDRQQGFDREQEFERGPRDFPRDPRDRPRDGGGGGPGVGGG